MVRYRARAPRVLLWLALLLGLFLPAAGAQAAPVHCRVGAYVMSISQVDTAAGTFNADFWMWSICPTKELQPLKSIELVNAVSSTTSLVSTLPRDGQWWTSGKISGTFRQDFALQNYPFDAEPLRIKIEEGELDARQLVYDADVGNSGMDPGVKLPGWQLKDFTLSSSVNHHPTTFGDPSLQGGSSDYAGLTLRVGVERAHFANFIKATFAVYIAVLLALISLLLTDGRMGMCGAMIFSVVISFVSVEGVVGPHNGVYLLDQIHVCALLLILAATGWGVFSLLARAHGGDEDVWLRRDRQAALALLGVFVLANIVMIGLTVMQSPAA